MTGVDFSDRAIALARSLASELGLQDARFVRSAIYDLPAVLDDVFDIVYTSGGVLGWLPDVRRWAQVVARYVRSGGRFFINEGHPVAMVFAEDDVAPGELKLAYPYWEHDEPITSSVKGSYADRDAVVDTPTEYGWDHSLGEIVTALIDAGLVIRSLQEYPYSEWKLGFLAQRPDGRWYLPEGTRGELPLSFSLLATKPSE